MKINPYKYPFIAIEGIDGCGKSTLIAGLKKWSAKNKIDAVFTKEPTDENVGQFIRTLLKNNGMDNRGNIASPLRMQELYIYDRLEHRYAEADFLQSYPVITDRDFISNIAYGMASNLGFNTLLRRHEEELKEYFFVPDLILILDLSAEEAIERLEKTKKKMDYFEKWEFLRKVRKAYLEFPHLIDKIYPDVALPCVFIRASEPPEKVLEDSLFCINTCFQKKLEAKQ